MGLETQNLWLQRIGYDFDGKKCFIKKYLFFLVENVVAEKNPKYFGNVFSFPIVISI